MTEKKAAKLHGFTKVAVIYPLILLLIIVLGLAVFYGFIYEYEYSRPKNAISRYMAEMDDNAFNTISESYLNSIDSNIQDREEAAQYARAAVEGADFLKKGSEGTDDSVVYALRYDGRTFGKFTLNQQKKGIFGFAPWKVSDAEFDFEALSAYREITVPANYTVECNGTALDKSYIADSSIQYEMLEDFYDVDVPMPTLCRYEFGPLLDDAVIRVIDPSGYVLSDEELGEEFFTDNCNMEQKQKIKDFVDIFIGRYVKYSSATDKNNTVNYGNLVDLMVPGSELVSRMVQAIEGLGWASSRDDVLDSITLNRCMDIGSGNYVCDVTYIVHTLGSESSVYVSTTNNVRIVLVDNGGRTLAAAMTSY